MSDSETKLILVSPPRQGALRIEIHRPEKKNALTLAMYSALAQAIQHAEADAATRVILLHGSQDCFTSGNDLKDFLEFPIKDESSPAFQFIKAISVAEKPIVAAVNGPAMGIGSTMLFHCDLVYAGPNARFQMPFVNLGLNPEAGSSLLLPRLAGYQRAAEILLLGEPFSAEKAREIGLVNGILPDAELIPFATAQAEKLAKKPFASVLLTKALLKKSDKQEVQEILSEEIRHIAERLNSPEAKEAFAAFLERRKPDFSPFQ
jgi:enoyl-CoA hydratase/carnithine racemase